MSKSTDVVIVGGGVIGLAVAWRLSQRGASVTVIDAAQPGQASTAAAGMLAPLAETHSQGPLIDLGIASLRCYPEFVAELASEIEHPLALCGPGLLRVARNEEETERLCAAFAWQKLAGLPLEWLDDAAVRSLEPGLSPTVQAAVLSPREQHLPPRLLHAALTEACARHKVVLRPEAVLRFATNASEVIGVQTASETVPCGEVLIAGGAWSVGLCEGLGIVCPVFPVCGQILALMPPSPLPFTHTIYASHGYLVPRPDGRIVVGATEEDSGYEARTTAEGIDGLLKMAQELVPELGSAPLDSAWAGLRPVSRDGLPLLGRAPGWDNVHLATGHGRNGILLTPITGMLMAEQILEDVTLPAAFDPARVGAIE